MDKQNTSIDKALNDFKNAQSGNVCRGERRSLR